MKVYLPVILDTAFVFVITSLILMVPIARRFNVQLTLAVSFTLSFAIALPSFFIIRKKKLSSLDKTADVTQKKVFLRQLCIMEKPELNALFISALKVMKVNCQLKNGTIFLSDKNRYIVYLFRFGAISDDELFSAINARLKNKSVLLFTNAEKLPEIVKNLPNAVCFDGDYTYRFIKSAGCLPKLPPQKSKSGTTKRFISKFFAKKNALRFFLLGAYSYLVGFFVPFYIYYLVFGGLFLVFALICLVYPEDKPAIEDFFDIDRKN